MFQSCLGPGSARENAHDGTGWNDAECPGYCIASCTATAVWLELPHTLSRHLRLNYCGPEEWSLSLSKIYLYIHIKVYAHGGSPKGHNSNTRNLPDILTSLVFLPSLITNILAKSDGLLPIRKYEQILQVQIKNM